MRRAASPDSRISSRSPSPNSSGRTSPAITANFLRLKSTNPSTSSGMRKLSSSPHLLGICEETEETIEPLKIPFHSTPRSISTISQKGPHLSRGNRSASIGLGNVTFSLKPSFTKEDSSSAPTTYSSVRVIRPRQAVVSPDMARRYDQHPRLLSRNRRSTSCSSENSETSDDDVNERKLSLIGSKYCKRNSDDKNNDDDAPKGGGGGGGGSNNGPRRSNSMKEQTIPEEENTNEKERSEKEQSSKKAAASKGCSFFLEASPSSSSISDSECFIPFGRQLSTPLQPIMEDNNFNLFNKSQATEDALFDWLKESKNCWENMEEIEEAFKECNKNEKFNFYRLLRRSKSMESLKATDSGLSYTGNSNTVIIVNVDEEIPRTESLEMTTTDSGCSSDNEERQPSFNNPKLVDNCKSTPIIIM
uniref:Uncharacterized protein n=1 Tax=Panagrolaimus superbus TaxID=310955 RepID=A0A914XSV4_9BILA